MADLKPAQFKLADFPIDPDKQSLLLLRQADGKLQAWHLGKKDGLAMLPQDHWWKNDGLACKELKVDFAGDRIYCGDAGLAAERQQYFSWRLNGAPLRQGGMPLEAAAGREADGDFVFNAPAKG
ncbi:hypothetical protein V8J88_23735 [Massilia sp. W12]|uniref:hypothetical protein n=1 Tax=Massilia sp. W12 TaxID=3126507 RepID=UPI0030D38657